MRPLARTRAKEAKCVRLKVYKQIGQALKLERRYETTRICLCVRLNAKAVQYVRVCVSSSAQPPSQRAAAAHTPLALFPLHPGSKLAHPQAVSGHAKRKKTALSYGPLPPHHLHPGRVRVRHPRHHALKSNILSMAAAAAFLVSPTRSSSLLPERIDGGSTLVRVRVRVRVRARVRVRVRTRIRI